MKSNERHILNSLETISKNLKIYSYEDLKNLIGYLVPNLPISTGTHDKLWRPKEGIFYRNPRFVYRARPNEIVSKGSTMKMPFHNLVDISIVPTEKTKNISAGRCNKKEERIFYSSNHHTTACIEAASSGFTRDFKNTTATLGCWQIEEPLNLAEIAFSKNTLKSLNQNTQFSYDEINELSCKLYSNLTENLERQPHNSYSIEFISLVYDFLANEFGKVEITTDTDYYLSNIYSDVIFNHSTSNDNGELYDGILYPSVKNALQEFNLAIHPRALKKIKFVCAYQIWITRHGDSLQFDELERAFADDNGVLKWNIFKT